MNSTQYSNKTFATTDKGNNKILNHIITGFFPYMKHLGKDDNEVLNKSTSHPLGDDHTAQQ